MHLALTLLTTCLRHLSNENVANSQSIKHRAEITYGVNKSVSFGAAMKAERGGNKPDR
jgi:hypothetical protein